MGSFCKRKPSVSYTNDGSGSGNTSGSSGAQMATNITASGRDGSQEAYDNLNPFQKAAQDLKMDMGIIEKDDQYFSNLASRNQASQDALNKLKENKSDRNKAKAAASAEEAEEAEAEEEEEVNEEEEADTVLDEETNEALEDVEEIADDTFGGGQEEGEVDPTDDIANYFDDTASSVNSAAAQDQNIASALTTSVGEAEDEAISYMDSGTASNVVNTGGAQGLLAGDDEDEFDPFNRRKTLIGA